MCVYVFISILCITIVVHTIHTIQYTLKCLLYITNFDRNNNYLYI